MNIQKCSAELIINTNSNKVTFLKLVILLVTPSQTQCPALSVFRKTPTQPQGPNTHKHYHYSDKGLVK